MKLKHLRSSVAGKLPQPADIDVGQIAINFNDGDPFLSIKDSAGAVRRLGGSSVGNTAPGAPTDGALWVDTSVNPPVLKIYDLTNTAWIDASPDATTSIKGIVQLADATAIAAGTVGRVVDAAQLKANTPPDASETIKGIAEIATTAEVTTGTDDTRIVTPAKLKAYVATNAPAPPNATETVKGIAEIATTAEVNAGTDDTRFVTPAKLQAFVTDQLKATWLPGDHIGASDIGTSTWNGPADTLTATPDVEVKIAAGTWGAGGAVAPADQVQVRWIASAVAAAAHAATLTGRVENAGGSVGVDYNVTIDKLPANDITVKANPGAAASAVSESDSSTAVHGINAALRLWLDSSDGTTPEVSIAGGAWTAVPATAAAGLPVNAGETFKLRHTTQAGASTVTTTTVRVGWDAASSVAASYVTTNSAVPSLVAGVATVIAGAAETGATLTATPGTATGGTAPIAYATRWQTSADGTSGWADLTGATGNTYAIQGSDLNKYLRAVTTATDSATPTAQKLDLPSIASAKVTAPVVVTLGWNAETDAYTRDPVANRIIDVHVRIRRCLLTDAGVPTYLDADDSTKLAGDWLRLCETTELNTPYTGTHGAEVANTALRAAAPAWTAGTYTTGQRVTNGGSVWECIAATTTAAPAAGAAAATLDGTAGQVMVEIPRFSVWNETTPAGSYKQHTFHLARGTKVDGGYAVHPAFVKPDNSYRDFIYVGAYLGTGTGGNGSASGVNNTSSITRPDCRTACSGRGVGWHQLGYWDYNALQWLLITEYQDMNSQKVLGNGAMTGNAPVVHTGLSNARGNRSGNAHTVAGATTDYVSYRGVENFYGRAAQWIDGINLSDLAVYLSNNPAQWADGTATNYTASGSVPTGGGTYVRDVMDGIALLPSSVTGASDTTFTGDLLWTSPGWRVPVAGGNAGDGSWVGALFMTFNYTPSVAVASISGRLCYAA
jgi:hypothetical protein